MQENIGLNGIVYLDMLENFLIPREDLHYRQDDTPPHFDLQIRDFLDNRFPDRWIGRAGPIV